MESHQHMLLDPKTTAARLFVKNLPTSGVTRLELHDLFSQYGKVLAVNYQQDFAFVQMDTPAQADAAVRGEHFRLFKNNQIKVFKARIPDERKLPPEMQRRDAEAPPATAPAVIAAPMVAPTHASSENERRTDCEIIVRERSQRSYAEMIERNLKRLGLAVDLLFPNESAPQMALLAAVAARGTLYALTVTPQHESKASVTVNILHGSEGGEEHRNMPVDKAVALVGRDFERYLGEGGRRKGVGALEALPPHVETLLSLLANSKPLTAAQYDALSSHLAQRRAAQARLEIGAPVPAVAHPSPAALPSQAEQLQQRIMSIMAQKLPPAPAPTPTTTPLLQDPQVQRALSSLFPSAKTF